MTEEVKIKQERLYVVSENKEPKVITGCKLATEDEKTTLIRALMEQVRAVHLVTKEVAYLKKQLVLTMALIAIEGSLIMYLLLK